MNPSTQTAVFIDTNVLLYAASDGKADPEPAEDMGHLQIYGKAIVINPFADQGRWIHDNPPKLSQLS